MPQSYFRDQGEALDFLKFARPILLTSGGDFEKVLRGRDDVISQFGSLFRDRPHTITTEQMGDFLQFERNCHWTGLHRQAPNILSDIGAVRRAVSVLVGQPDRNLPLKTRFDMANKMVKGFGPGIMSPILFVAYPSDYGVWNSKSEAGLKQLGLWFQPHKASPGELYEAVRARLFHVRRVLNEQMEPGIPKLDFWTIDYYWHALWVLDEEGKLESLVREFRAARGNG